MTNTTTKTITKPQRYQITLPKTSQINNRIASLLQKYDGMTLTEIVKLAIIQLDNSNNLSIEETDYIKSDPVLYKRLLKSKQTIENGTVSPVVAWDTDKINSL
jgi:hypothetical protein